ncbi:MAG: FAD-dependent thymidylate synthase, partial [Clostridia bacterium]|nr:FAD-dependent thymidylate synthase [Clostridia bacterium]
RHRCCYRAQWEIRDLAEQMYALCAQVAPHLFRHAGPPCVSGACPEGKMSCGQAKEVRERYRLLREKQQEEN